MWGLLSSRPGYRGIKLWLKQGSAGRYEKFGYFVGKNCLLEKFSIEDNWFEKSRPEKTIKRNTRIATAPAMDY